MSNFKKLSHVIYKCNYIVWTTKYHYLVSADLVKDQLARDIVMPLKWKLCELIEMII